MPAGPDTAPKTEKGVFRAAIWNIGVEVVKHYYQHPDIRFPAAVAEALAHLDKLEHNPMRPSENPTILDADVTKRSRPDF